MTQLICELNDVEIQVFTLRLQNQYLRSYGNDYENFVGDILARCYPGDFMPVSSAAGDNKNDGIIMQTRHLYQCYAPAKFNDTATMNRKIREDYEGAIQHWGEDFDIWKFSFCHPKDDGANKETVKLILDLQKAHGKKIDFVGMTGMVSLALTMPRTSLIEWLGPPPIMVRELGFDLPLPTIGLVIKAIANSDIAIDDMENIDPVPPTKLAYNRIPASIQDYIEKGKGLSNRVGQYLATSAEPLLGQQMAEKFREEYQHIRQQDEPVQSAETVYWRLYDFIRHRLAPPLSEEQQLAVHAVLSYLFHHCDIFDRPPAGWTGH
ncbi:ABC-three component system protein [Deinococcus indicus]|uniref:ABC-three component system protein n=1 Tax=Deinococcus indicus TaxID=223556 RepID=UPI0011773E20|nr:ABC-three component system protein [Deinococcus indicus]